MRRGKIEIKRIEKSSSRQVTYVRRRNNIIKKAKEITALCDAHVSLIIFSSEGKMHHFTSPSTSLVDILQKYHRHADGKRFWDSKHEDLDREIERIKKENDNMQIKLKHIKGEDDITSLTHKNLIDIEDALENGLSSIRHRQSEIVKMHRKNLKMIEEEHAYLIDELHRRKMALEASVRGFTTTDLQDRVQPIQPNLQDRVQPIQPNLQDQTNENLDDHDASFMELFDPNGIDTSEAAKFHLVKESGSVRGGDF